MYNSQPSCREFILFETKNLRLKERIIRKFSTKQNQKKFKVGAKGENLYLVCNRQIDRDLFSGEFS
jgi:hypothetical protein